MAIDNDSAKEWAADAEQISSGCPHCHGTGYVRRERWFGSFHCTHEMVACLQCAPSSATPTTKTSAEERAAEVVAIAKALREAATYPLIQRGTRGRYIQQGLCNAADAVEILFADLIDERSRTFADAARIADLEAQVERLTRERDEVGTALVSLTCNGSEFYLRDGDGFRVDPAACVAYARRSMERWQERLKRFAARATEAERRRDVMREALRPFAENPDAVSLARVYGHLTREDAYRARAALTEGKQP